VARIVLGGYMVRYPLGGMLAGYVQWLVGFQRLGHEIYAVEKAGGRGSCYDPRRDLMTDDCSSGFALVTALLERFGLEGRLCFVDADGLYHGLTQPEVERVFDAADLFVDLGTHGAWLDDAKRTGVRIYVDGEPGARQLQMQQQLDARELLPSYDHWYTVGQSIGTPASSAPTAGRTWRHVFHPVVVDLFAPAEANGASAYTTVMNWRSHEPLEYGGTSYLQKDAEFEHFIDLPARTHVPLEIAVAGAGVPARRLGAAGWHVRDAHQVTASYDTFVEYVAASRGEFSVSKHVYVATRSGWFGDRSAVYLASGRPVVLQDTGLFAVSSVDEAAAALETIERDRKRHAKAARELAREHLDAEVVLTRLLAEIGL
jgi:hypothetical protein